MDEAEAQAIFNRFLASKTDEVGIALAVTPKGTQRLANGWAFTYQSRSFIETGDFSQMLVGQGPVIVLDDGRIAEGGSLDTTPQDVLRRHGQQT